MSVFCYKSCQCNSKYGFWTLLIQKFLLTNFITLSAFAEYQCSIIEGFSPSFCTVGFNPGIQLWWLYCELLESLDCVTGLFHLRVLVNCVVMRIHVPSGLTVVAVFFKMICSFTSAVIIAIHRVHSAHFH